MTWMTWALYGGLALIALAAYFAWPAANDMPEFRFTPEEVQERERRLKAVVQPFRPPNYREPWSAATGALVCSRCRLYARQSFLDASNRCPWCGWALGDDSLPYVPPQLRTRSRTPRADFTKDRS